MKAFYQSLLSICAVLFLLTPSAHGAKSDRTINVTMDPISLLIGLPGFGVSYFLTDRISVGVIGSFLVTDTVLKAAVDSTTPNFNYSIGAHSVGLEGMYGLSDSLFENTWYLSPSVSKTSISIKELDQGFSGTADVTSARLMLGYSWMNTSGFNMRVGAGFASTIEEKYEVLDPNGISSLSEDDLQSFATSFAIEFKLGWAF